MSGIMAPHCEIGQGSGSSLTLHPTPNLMEDGMNRRFEVYQFRQVLLHMRQGETDRSIGRARLLGRKKAGALRSIAEAEGWLNPDIPLPNDKVLAEKLVVKMPKRSTTSQVAPFADLVRTWVAEGIQATTIYSALKREKGFTGHYSAVQRFVQKLRPPDKDPTMILDFSPGEVAQVDFGSGPMIVNPETGKPERTWFFLMTLACSRHAYAEVVKNQKIATWQECHRRAFEFFQGVPRKVVIDNLKAAILRACLYDPEIQRSYEAFAEGYGFIIGPCPPKDPEKKGRVEAGVKYLKKAFMPLRTFRSVADANRQLREWLIGEAGQRIHGTTGKRPVEVFSEVEQPLLQALPINPPETVEWAKGQVYRNNHVRFDKNWYSAPFSLIDKEVWVRAGPRTVQVFRQNELVATHSRRFGHGEHQTVQDHLSPACRSFLEQSPDWCREQAAQIGLSCQEVVDRLLVHPRVDCLRAAQRIVGFRKTSRDEHLEAACEQALACNSVRVATVRGILARLASEANLEDVPGPRGPAYQGAGRFVRQNVWSIPTEGGLQ